MGRLDFKGVQMKPSIKGGGISIWVVLVGAIGIMILVLSALSSKQEPPKPKKIEPKPDWRNLK